MQENGTNNKEKIINGTVTKPNQDYASEKMISDMQRVSMPKLPAKDRIKSFDEVELGLPEELALKEALRCLGCEVGICVGCKICADVCPDACISITTESTETGKVFAKSYEIDASLCMFCGLCQEICPTKTLSHSKLYELSTYDKKGMVYSMNELTSKELNKPEVI